MKKLLIILGITILSTIAITSIVACEQENKPSPIPPHVEKSNLNTITELTGLNLTVDTTKKFKDIDFNIIIQADQFKNKCPLFGKLGFEIKYYMSKNDDYNIATSKQIPGNFWIVIKVAPCDIYWKGQTSKLQIILKI